MNPNDISTSVKNKDYVGKNVDGYCGDRKSFERVGGAILKITFRLNGKDVETSADATTRLIDVLRDEMNLIGTKEGCGDGECGACSVLVNNLVQNSCLIPIGSIEGADILTIEGFNKTKQYKLLNECYSEAGGVQCGFCTPGMVMASTALLSKNPHATEVEIREGISGNLCRCTGYNMIVDAIHLAAKKGEGLW